MEKKIEKIRELVKEIKSYDELLYMYERDKIDLDILKQELWELLQELWIKEKDMEKEIKITLVPKEQTGKEYDSICITCGYICVFGNTLEAAIKAFDTAISNR